MQLDEELEKAFNAGANFIIDNSYTDEDSDWVENPTDREIDLAYTEYINGNSKHYKSKTILDQGK